MFGTLLCSVSSLIYVNLTNFFLPQTQLITVISTANYCAIRSTHVFHQKHQYRKTNTQKVYEIQQNCLASLLDFDVFILTEQLPVLFVRRINNGRLASCIGVFSKCFQELCKTCKFTDHTNHFGQSPESSVSITTNRKTDMSLHSSSEASELKTYHEIQKVLFTIEEKKTRPIQHLVVAEEGSTKIR